MNKCHGKRLLINHYVTDIEQGRSIAAQIDNAAMSADEVCEWIAGGVLKIYYRFQVRALYLLVIIDGVYPQVMHNIHFREFAHSD